MPADHKGSIDVVRAAVRAAITGVFGGGVLDRESTAEDRCGAASCHRCGMNITHGSPSTSTA